MMETKELICVNCPMGCRITVQTEDKKILSIEGNTCSKGKAYAEQECIRPMRILTSTVKINGGVHRVLPVITETEIPLELMEQAMEQVRGVVAEAPVRVGDVVAENIAGTGVSLIASRSMKKS